MWVDHWAVRWWGIVLTATLFVAGGTFVWTQGRAGASESTCRSTSAASQALRAKAVDGPRPRIAVIGDSYSQGSHLEDPTEGWPSRLSGSVMVDGFAGSGFTASPCPGVAFGRRVGRALATDPDLVVVQGGLNDVNASVGELRAEVSDVLESLTGRRTVLVGPPAAPRRAEGARRVDAQLAELAAAADVPYISTVAWQLEFLDDRLHLTDAGHVAFGDAVVDALDR